MATPDDSESTNPRKRSTPPPRPGKGGRPRPAAKGGSAARPSAGNRNSAANRRAAVAQERRRKQTLLAALGTGVVIVVVAVFVIVKATGGGTHHTTAASKLGSGQSHSGAASSSAAGNPVPAYVYSGFKAVKASTLEAAATNASVSDLVDPKVVNDAAITTKGKPELLYLGAEFCPYCATERWAMVMALSQFGTFHDLHSTESMANDSSGYDNVPTFTFYKSSYTSPYLKFVPVEEEDRSGAALQTATAAENAVQKQLDSGGSIPFVDFNGKALIVGAEYNPSYLLHGNFIQDAKSVIAGTSSLATAVDANAGAIVSDICRMTGGKPGSVCKLFPKPITR